MPTGRLVPGQRGTWAAAGRERLRGEARGAPGFGRLPADAGPRSPHCRLEAPRPHLQADCCKREPSSSQVPVPHMPLMHTCRLGCPTRLPSGAQVKTSGAAGGPVPRGWLARRRLRVSRGPEDAQEEVYERSLIQQPAVSACAGGQSSTANLPSGLILP